MCLRWVIMLAAEKFDSWSQLVKHQNSRPSDHVLAIIASAGLATSNMARLGPLHQWAANTLAAA